MGRERYSGDWKEGMGNLFRVMNMTLCQCGYIISPGTKTGTGTMSFVSGDSYYGTFRDGVPHGQGKFSYSDGSTEEALWEDGTRHGLSKFVHPDGTEEEIMFWEGEAEGPAKLTNPNGSYEERQYSKGGCSQVGENLSDVT